MTPDRDVQRATLMGGSTLKGYAEFVPAPFPMTLGEKWVLCRAGAFDEILEALKSAREIVEADIESKEGPLEAVASAHARRVLVLIDAAIQRAGGEQQ